MRQRVNHHLYSQSHRHEKGGKCIPSIFIDTGNMVKIGIFTFIKGGKFITIFIDMGKDGKNRSINLNLSQHRKTRVN